MKSDYIKNHINKIKDITNKIKRSGVIMSIGDDILKGLYILALDVAIYICKLLLEFDNVIHALCPY